MATSVISPTIPITNSPALQSVAAEALRERRLRFETINKQDDTFRSQNDNLPSDNHAVAAVQARLIADESLVNPADLFLAQLLSQQELPGEVNADDFLSLTLDNATLSQPEVLAAIDQPQFADFYAATPTRYGVPIVQSLLV